uniref:Uncharacterized protein n=1 Tax=Mycena chlorophos TaxID=658473 RepID=A0ABQ0KUF0_MYCCL|nr:predicted protein [Mycena chlorophos]
MRAYEGMITTAFVRKPTAVRALQSRILAIVTGRVAQPQVRTFTFTLDGHDFYCVRLGDDSTLVYDNSTQQWTEWTSDDLPFWRVNTGINWVGGQAIGVQFGNTDIVVGDDTWGVLYFLDPTQGFDDFPDNLAPESSQQVPFPRVCMAQTTVNGRNFVPCYAVFLDGDNYGLTANFTPYVQLETSDDQGLSWINHGVITLQPNTFDQDYRWTSLGQMQSPGRLFKITDNGILQRIDSLEMSDD